jgi:acyl-coenzyme A thioesterase PaaI-like protein
MTQRKVVAAQNLSRMCLVCGVQNPWGLRGRFYVLDATGPGDSGQTGGTGELLGVFALREEHQSYPGRLHGGIATAILDETIGRAITIANPGVWGVTAELTVRFRKPLPVSGELRCLGRITRDTRRLFEGAGEIRLDDGTVAAEASGRYVKMSLGDITDDDFDQRDWFADEGDLPESVDL